MKVHVCLTVHVRIIAKLSAPSSNDHADLSPPSPANTMRYSYTLLFYIRPVYVHFERRRRRKKLSIPLCRKRTFHIATRFASKVLLPLIGSRFFFPCRLLTSHQPSATSITLPFIPSVSLGAFTRCLWRARVSLKTPGSHFLSKSFLVSMMYR